MEYQHDLSGISFENFPPNHETPSFSHRNERKREIGAQKDSKIQKLGNFRRVRETRLLFHEHVAR